METSTLNLILGFGFGFVSFALAYKWIVEGIIAYRMYCSNDDDTQTITLEEFYEMLEDEDENY